MAYYDYLHLKKIGFGIAWLDITDKITDSTALALSKNITEYWVQENENFQLATTCSKDPDTILSWAADQGLNYVMVTAIGTNLAKRNNLHHEMPQFLDKNPNFAVAGHILDKGDKFYELHHQCFIVNMNWWKNNGRPQIGREEYSTAWTTVKPKRSEENWHDNYTPHWIAQGDVSENYTGRRFGWNIIDTALKTSAAVVSFDESLRESKYYIYPEVAGDFHSKISEVLESLQGYGHFAANTESPPDKLLDTDMQGVICTAGGITPLLTAYTAGLRSGGKVTVFDFSPVSLAIQRRLREINCDYKDFKTTFYSLFGELHLGPMIKADRNLDRMQELINKMMPEGLEDFIKNVWPHLDILFTPCNLFDISQVKNRLADRHAGEKTYIHLTNILHYQNSAWLFSATSRYRLEQDILNKFANSGMDTFKLYQNRPGFRVNWRNETPREILANPDKFLYRAKTLEILPWIKK
jgi:hypothetical protein